eukprot:CAMPEP_0113706280 /NCGR_PEP_ID=MMETSP0038_2-20120614/27630_1 /TAXON_ID=2898 /ORGANISM="Cryptomonas paramecium" /LENGTH=70 /DNA_ID=CAMNT_0000631441 /DNA_START=67 /DNA_END=275 /DNA_ORIENTATION=+ /assembly_acc=CAM_ASM_000170
MDGFEQHVAAGWPSWALVRPTASTEPDSEPRAVRRSMLLRAVRRCLSWESVFVDDGLMEAAYGANWNASV